MTDDHTSGNHSRTANWRQVAALVTILLFALAGLNFHWPTLSHTAARTGTANTVPDIIVNQPDMDDFDEQGRKIRQLQGEQLRHFDNDNRSEFSAPHVRFARQDKHGQWIPWQLQADKATVFHDSGKIDLAGNAVLWSDATPDGRTEIRSELIHVDTARQFAETDKAVTIRARRSETTAIGLQADLANERLSLPMRVKETHEAPR